MGNKLTKKMLTMENHNQFPPCRRV